MKKAIMLIIFLILILNQVSAQNITYVEYTNNSTLPIEFGDLNLFPFEWYFILIISIILTYVVCKADITWIYIISDVILAIFIYHIVTNINELGEIYVYLAFILAIEFLITSFAIKDKKDKYYSDE